MTFDIRDNQHIDFVNELTAWSDRIINAGKEDFGFAGEAMELLRTWHIE